MTSLVSELHSFLSSSHYFISYEANEEEKSVQATMQSYHGREWIWSFFATFWGAALPLQITRISKVKVKVNQLRGVIMWQVGRGIFWQVASLFSCFPKCKCSNPGSCFLSQQIAERASGRWVLRFKSWDISTKFQSILTASPSDMWGKNKKKIKSSFLWKIGWWMEGGNLVGTGRNTTRDLKPRMDTRWSPDSTDLQFWF